MHQRLPFLGTHSVHVHAPFTPHTTTGRTFIGKRGNTSPVPFTLGTITDPIFQDTSSPGSKINDSMRIERTISIYQKCGGGAGQGGVGGRRKDYMSIYNSGSAGRRHEHILISISENLKPL